MIREKPIIFSKPMVEAILSGRKTQTRRILKKQPPLGYRFFGYITESTNKNSEGKYAFKNIIEKIFGSFFEIKCPYGKVGDRLWVRENIEYLGNNKIQYKADKLIRDDITWVWKNKYLPSIHLPRGLSRITLKITNIRIECLNDISEEDAIAEGCFKVGDCTPPNYDRKAFKFCNGFAVGYFSALDAFFSLWEKINGKDSWAKNPWVWVIEFRRIENDR